MQFNNEYNSIQSGTITYFKKYQEQGEKDMFDENWQLTDFFKSIKGPIVHFGSDIQYRISSTAQIDWRVVPIFDE